MENKLQIRINITGTIRNLAPGGSVSFPIEKLASVKTLTTMINRERCNSDLSTSINRGLNNPVVTVTRAPEPPARKEGWQP